MERGCWDGVQVGGGRQGRHGGPRDRRQHVAATYIVLQPSSLTAREIWEFKLTGAHRKLKIAWDHSRRGERIIESHCSRGL